MSDRYAVAGNPVAHSRSPWIHARFAEQTGQDIVYERLLIEEGRFDEAARAFFASGARGMNVTLPFKQDAFRFADTLGTAAREAGAVNTLTLRPDGTIHGDNTDGAGLIRDLAQNLRWELEAKSVLLMGAGGAARGVIVPLLACRPSSIVIANRTVSRAAELAQDLARAGNIVACGYQELGCRFDLIINASSASLHDELPPLPEVCIDAGTHCYDMAYGHGETTFLQKARSLGCSRLADGLGMLVEQAAESFLIWRGVRPRTRELIVELRGSQADA